MVASKRVETLTRTALAAQNGSFPETEDRFNTHGGTSAKAGTAFAWQVRWRQYPSMGIHGATQDVPKHGDASERHDDRETGARAVRIRGLLRGGFMRAV
jgi:hypothetical protein